MAEIEINVMVSQCLDLRINSIETVHSEVDARQARRDNLKLKTAFPGNFFVTHTGGEANKKSSITQASMEKTEI